VTVAEGSLGATGTSGGGRRSNRWHMSNNNPFGSAIDQSSKPRLKLFPTGQKREEISTLVNILTCRPGCFLSQGRLQSAIHVVHLTSSVWVLFYGSVACCVYGVARPDVAHSSACDLRSSNILSAMGPFLIFGITRNAHGTETLMWLACYMDAPMNSK
jgi:hypothetical protein